MPRTAREMTCACQGHEYAEWERTAALIAATFEVNRDPKQRRSPYTPQEFFKRPGAKRAPRGTPLTPEALRAMKPAFTKPRD